MEKIALSLLGNTEKLYGHKSERYNNKKINSKSQLDSNLFF